MLKKLVTESQTNQSDIVCCAFSKFDETGNNYTEGELFQPHRLSRENFLSLLLADGRYKKLCGRGGMVWKCLYRASCIHGLRFDEDRNICEDELFNTQAALHADIITYIPEVLYLYRVRRHLTAPSAQWDLKLAEGRLRAFGIAQKISEEAALLLGAAYIKTILSLAKKTRNQPPVAVKISSSWIEKNCRFEVARSKEELPLVFIKPPSSVVFSVLPSSSQQKGLILTMHNFSY